nr:phenylalanine--tRNA ligase subunit alpha [Bacillus subtilis]
MEEKLKQLEQEALEQVEAASSLKVVNDIRVQYLGKKGTITEVLRGMGKLSAEERPKMGALANEVRERIANAIADKNEKLEEEEMKQKLAGQTIDVTLPGNPVAVGGTAIRSLLSLKKLKIYLSVWATQSRKSTEVETDYYNFESLNLPKEHPARDMQDSFYITEETLMRTQTSPVQTRTMEKHEGKGPVKIICPGKVYRRDNDDATHSHQFMQIEGLVVDKNISMSDLKGTLELVAKKMFVTKTAKSDSAQASSRLLSLQ